MHSICVRIRYTDENWQGKVWSGSWAGKGEAKGMVDPTSDMQSPCNHDVQMHTRIPQKTDVKYVPERNLNFGLKRRYVCHTSCFIVLNGQAPYTPWWLQKLL